LRLQNNNKKGTIPQKKGRRCERHCLINSLEKREYLLVRMILLHLGGDYFIIVCGIKQRRGRE